MSTTILNESSQLLLAKTLNELIRRDKKCSPAALARNLGIPTNKITRILNGDVTDPKASTLVQIAHYFNISIEQLLGLEPIVRLGEYEQQEVTRPLPVFDFSKIAQSKSPQEWYRWVENDVDGEYYALSIDTDLYEPTFPKNSLLIINQDIMPDDRSYIVVKKKDSSHYSIKKYVVEGNERYLYPINPKLPVEIYDDNLYTVVGVILEIHQKLRSKK
ncbi:helix-turn-helix domain-containing protein [Legionella sp. D16C41]|uniref:helix-turn-helix domain-containing protein n=1 Tax=Legionella sp. D16C41 TaxID=3402688 RepID=UPI003AF96B92